MRLGCCKIQWMAIFCIKMNACWIFEIKLSLLSLVVRNHQGIVQSVSTLEKDRHTIFSLKQFISFIPV